MFLKIIKKNRSIIIGLLILFLATNYRLLRPGILSMQDDLHVFRLQQFDLCLKDLQIPCRYAPEAGLGYGSPVFNFYPPLTYFIAEIFHLIGFSFVESIKLLFIVPGIIRIVSMYLLASLFFGPVGGLISTTVFSLAPYQATNTFVRGAIAENLAISLLPLLFWALKKNNYKSFTIVLTLLLLTHHLTLIYIIPLLFIYVILEKKVTQKLFISGAVSFLLSAFYTLPALFEKHLTTVKTMTLGYFDYHNHFADLYELFISRFWGYGASQWGPVDDMSFQLGYLQWILPLAVIALLIAQKKLLKNKATLLFFIVGLFSLFLTHQRSNFIWEKIPFLAYYQFPWRFVGLATFTLSFITGHLALIIPKKYLFNLAALIMVISVFLNIQYFKEDIWFSQLTDTQKLSGPSLIQQSGAGLKDYWPYYGADVPEHFAPQKPAIISGNVIESTFSKKSNYAAGSITVSSETVVNLPIVYFPGWILKINNIEEPISFDPELGLIQLKVYPDKTTYELTFKNTLIRTIANSLTVFGSALLIIYLVREKKS